MLKDQRFENIENDKTELRVSKHQRMNTYNDKKEQGLDEYEGQGEGEDVVYILFLAFVALFSSQKKSNHLIKMDKGIKSLNYLIYIPKIG